MVNDQTIERERVGRDPMGDPAEDDPSLESGEEGLPETPDETLTEGAPPERPKSKA